MPATERPITFHIVTSSNERIRAWNNLLTQRYPGSSAHKIAPGFTESVMHRPVNSSPSEWPFEVAKEKALQDIAGLLVLGAIDHAACDNLLGDHTDSTGRTIRMYSDTVQVSYDAQSPDDTPLVLEKPISIESWLADRERGAMAQSGKNFEICTALTGIDLANPNAHPATILVRVAGKMRPYTMEDMIHLINTHGKRTVEMAAGGVSIQNGGTTFYDKTEPLRIFIQTDPNSPPQLVSELPTWSHVGLDTLQRFVYGAIPEAVETLLTQIDNSAKANQYAKKQGLIFPFPSNSPNTFLLS